MAFVLASKLVRWFETKDSKIKLQSRSLDLVDSNLCQEMRVKNWSQTQSPVLENRVMLFCRWWYWQNGWGWNCGRGFTSRELIGRKRTGHKKGKSETSRLLPSLLGFPGNRAFRNRVDEGCSLPSCKEEAIRLHRNFGRRGKRFASAGEKEAFCWGVFLASHK